MNAKKRILLIIILAVAFTVLAVVYFAVIAPMLSSEDEGIDLDLMDGEVRISDKLSNFYIFEPVKRSEIQSIKVINGHGGYEIYRDSSDAFQLRGTSGLRFNAEKFSSLIVTAGTPVAMSRIARDLGSDEWGIYGLDKPQASWTLETSKGEKLTVNVGDKLLSHAGYYVSLEGRNAVYIVSTSLEETILAEGYSLVEPLLTAGMTQNDYYLADNFVLLHGQEMFVAVDRTSRDTDDRLALTLLYPYPDKEKREYYNLDTDTYLDAVRSMVDLTGDQTVAINPTDGTLMEFGLLSPAYTVYYTFGGNEFYVIVSAKQSDGFYYAVSNLFGYQIVCRVPAETLKWLDYTEFSWIQSNPFYENITSVRRIEIETPDGINVDFVLAHGTDESGNATLEVKERNSGTVIENRYARNFRQYYLTLLNITNKDYSSFSKEDRETLIADESRLLMKMRIELTDGSFNEYRFYQYYEESTGKLSTGKVFVVVNDFGEFYTSNDLIDKVKNDTPRVLEGLDIDGYGQR
ncbi:MAG: DUF4340 domain-containing protein [Clostridia bacterium]|nr:DUF4340 domain-containing protein [Clostridia bacterium]